MFLLDGEFPAELLPLALDLNGSTGAMVWRRRPRCTFRSDRAFAVFNGRFPGLPAFTAVVRGYRQGSINDRLYPAHRVVWALHYGHWPAGLIDHIDGNGLNNAVANLREVDRAGNGQNAARSRRNSSGVTGVSWNARDGRWTAWIMARGRRHYLGSFIDLDAAVATRKAAEVRLGFHPNHGRTRKEIANAVADHEARRA